MKNLAIIIFMILLSYNSQAALNKTVCADLIVAKIVARNPGTDPNQIKPYWEDICDALITHIQTDAVVNSTGTGTATVGSGSSAGAWPTADTNVGTIQ